MSHIYVCDECGAEDVPVWQELLRYRPVGKDKNTRKEKMRSTGRHLCEPCIEETAPKRRDT